MFHFSFPFLDQNISAFSFILRRLQRQKLRTHLKQGQPVWMLNSNSGKEGRALKTGNWNICWRHSQRVPDPDWDRTDRSLGVPLHCVPRGKRDAPCRYAAREPEEKWSSSFKVWKGEGRGGVWPSADHLREERLAVHIHKGQVEPTYVQYGRRQIDVQDRSLGETGDETGSKENRMQRSFEASWAVTSTLWLGAIPGPRTKSGTLMSNSYSCLLSMGNENWPEHSRDSEAAVREGADSGRRRRRLGSDLCGSRCPRCRRCRCCSAPRCPSASLPAFPPCRPQRPASATCGTGAKYAN